MRFQSGGTVSERETAYVAGIHQRSARILAVNLNPKHEQREGDRSGWDIPPNMKRQAPGVVSDLETRRTDEDDTTLCGAVTEIPIEHFCSDTGSVVGSKRDRVVPRTASCASEREASKPVSAKARTIPSTHAACRTTHLRGGD